MHSVYIAVMATLVSLCICVEGIVIKPAQPLSAPQHSGHTEIDVTAEKSWATYKGKYYKKYNNAEDQKRFKTFLKNKKLIKEHNAMYKKGLTSFEMSENQFSDWTNTEYKKFLSSGKPRGVRQTSQELGVEWTAFKEKYNKEYSDEEDEKRLNIYLENKRKVEAHNANYDKGLTTYRQGLNSFADLKPEELSVRLGFRRP